MSQEPYDPDTTLGAWQRLGDAIRALWWEIVYASRLDVLAGWLADRIGSDPPEEP